MKGKGIIERSTVCLTYYRGRRGRLHAPQNKTNTMKKTTTMTIENLSSNYVSALRRAETAAATAGQQGAWLLACHMASGLTIDEAFEAVKTFLREKGEGQNAIERSRPLVPFAVDLRESEGGNEFPKAAKWPTIAFAKAVATVTNRTAASVGSFAHDMEEACEAADQDLTASFLVKGLDREPTREEIEKRVVSLAAAKRRKGGESGEGDKVLSLLRKPESLREKLSVLTEKELEALENVIDDVRLARIKSDI